jgi:hypothetical protein
MTIRQAEDLQEAPVCLLSTTVWLLYLVASLCFPGGGSSDLATTATNAGTSESSSTAVAVAEVLMVLAGGSFMASATTGSWEGGAMQRMLL